MGFFKNNDPRNQNGKFYCEYENKFLLFHKNLNKP